MFSKGYDESGITPEPRDASSWQMSFQKLAGDDCILGGSSSLWSFQGMIQWKDAILWGLFFAMVNHEKNQPLVDYIYTYILT